jgi:hypothetical protein
VDATNRFFQGYYRVTRETFRQAFKKQFLFPENFLLFVISTAMLQTPSRKLTNISSKPSKDGITRFIP